MTSPSMGVPRATTARLLGSHADEASLQLVFRCHARLLSVEVTIEGRTARALRPLHTSTDGCPGTADPHGRLLCATVETLTGNRPSLVVRRALSLLIDGQPP